MTDFKMRARRLARELQSKGVQDERVLEAIREVPRHLFVPEHLQDKAYRDHALPIECDQTISQPFIVAKMTEYLQVGPDHSVLEIGTGSGYQTAILSRLCRFVYSIERIGELARAALQRMRMLGAGNVKIQIFDGTIGWSDHAPFDRILVTAGAPTLPKPLLEQLAVGGRLVLPEGDDGAQRLRLYDREEDQVVVRSADAVSFVPLIGRYGHAEKRSG